MKKILVWLMIVMMIVSMSAFAEGTTAATENAEEAAAEVFESIALNEKKSTEYFEVTLTQVDFAKQLVDGSGALKNILLPTEEKTEYAASEGKIFLVYTADLNYIGKEEMNACLGAFELNYADGYKFKDYRVQVLRDNGKMGWVKTIETSQSGSVSMKGCKFEPLVDTKYILRGYFEVPEVVATQESEPLTMTVNILGEKFNYTIR